LSTHAAGPSPTDSAAQTPTPPRAATSEPATARETVLTLLALAAGGTSSLLVVAASAQLAPMPLLFWAVGLPGMALVAAILVYARFAGLDRLCQRLWLGLVGGIVLTLALDAVRVAGVHLGYLPDSVTMFGNMITATPAMAEPTPLSYALGGTYHFFNGISFALVYSILFGRSRWWGPVLFSVAFVEVGMMTLPPMAPKFGAFGIETFGSVWNGYFLDTLLAHAAMGLALGVIMQHFARYRGLLLAPLTRQHT
jgi:hypothetical protein